MGRVRLDVSLLVSAVNILLDQLNMTLTYNVNDLARRLNVSYTVAWRIAEKIKGKRVASIRAIPNYDILGLKLVAGIASIENKNWLNDFKRMTYVHYYAPIYGTGGRRAFFVLYPPKGLEDEALGTVEKLVGPVEQHFPIERVLTTKIERYGWPPKVDWEKALSNWYSVYAPSQRVAGTVRFDQVDLLVLSRLQEQGLWKVIDLARAVNLARKTMEYRLRQRVRWMVGGFKADLWSYARDAPIVALLAEGKGSETLAALATIPYPSTVMIGKDSSVAILALPEEEHYPFFRTLSEYVSEWRMYFIDKEATYKFAVPKKALTEKATWTKEMYK